MESVRGFSEPSSIAVHVAGLHIEEIIIRNSN